MPAPARENLAVFISPPAVQSVPSYSKVVLKVAVSGLCPPNIKPAVKVPHPAENPLTAGIFSPTDHPNPSYSSVC